MDKLGAWVAEPLEINRREDALALRKRIHLVRVEGAAARSGVHKAVKPAVLRAPMMIAPVGGGRLREDYWDGQPLRESRSMGSLTLFGVLAAPVVWLGHAMLVWVHVL